MPRPLPRKLRDASDSVGASRPSPRPRPRPHPVEPEAAETSRRPLLPALSTRLLAALGAVAVVLAVASGVLFWQDSRASATVTASEDAVAAARTGAETLFSYDYRTIDANLAAGQKVVAGSLAKDYADTTKVVKPTAVANKAVVKATVSQAGVVSASPDQVVVLLYLNQATQNTKIQGTRMDMNRVRVTMEKVDGDWKIVRAEPL
jgi:Mce-associated membrane protein